MMEFCYKLLGLPVLASENGRAVDDLIVYIHWLMVALFVGWFGYFIFTLWRFNAKRNPKADHHGVRGHASSYIELIVAGLEVVLLCFVAIPLWSKASDVSKIPDAKDAVVVQLVAQQFNWNFRYAGVDGKFGKQSMDFVTSDNMFGVDPQDASGKDDVQVLNEMHVPIGKPVIVYCSSKDVIHSFKVIALRVTQDAIPGMRIPTWFKPTLINGKDGKPLPLPYRYQINCAQLCGNLHSAMKDGLVVVQSQADYDAWMAKKSAGAAAGPQSFE